MGTKTDRSVKFVKIIEVDDWASVGYYLRANKSVAGTWSHRSLDQTHRLKNGDKLEVQCPDGTVVKAKAVVTSHSTEYYDHGHTYSTMTEALTIVPLKPVKLHGLSVNFTDLKKIKVRRAR